MYKLKFVGIFWLLGVAFTLNSVHAQTIMDELRAHNQTVNFAEALEKTDLNERLNQSGPFTLFVPSNEAFNNLSSGQRTNRNLLLNHIFTGMATERSLRVMSDITCLSGRTVKIENGNNQQLSIDNFTIIESNIRARNGVIHIIDGVIR